MTLVSMLVQATFDKKPHLLDLARSDLCCLWLKLNQDTPTRTLPDNQGDNDGI